MIGLTQDLVLSVWRLEMKIKNKQNSTRNLVILDSYRGKFILVNMKNKNKNVVAQVNPLLKHKISQ